MISASRIRIFGLAATIAIGLVVGFQNCSPGYNAAQLSSFGPGDGIVQYSAGPVAGQTYEVSNSAGSLATTGSNLALASASPASFVLVKTADPALFAIQDQASGQCFSASNGTAGAGSLSLAPCSLSDAQAFAVEYTGEGRSSIRSLAAAKCLAGAAGTPQLRGCSALDDQQRWIFAPPNADLDPVKLLRLGPPEAADASGAVVVSGHSGSLWVNVAAYAVSNGAIDLNRKVGADITPANGSFTISIDTKALPNGTDTVAVRAFSVPAGQPATDVATKFIVLEVNNGTAPAPAAPAFALNSALDGSKVNGPVMVDLTVGSKWQNVAAYPVVNGAVNYNVKIAMDQTPVGGVAHLLLDPTVLPNGPTSVAFVAFDTPAEVPFKSNAVITVRIDVNNARVADAAAADSPVVTAVRAIDADQVQLTGRLGSGWSRVSVYPVLATGAIDVRTKIAADVTPVNGAFTAVVQRKLVPSNARGIYVYAYTAGGGSLVRTYQALPAPQSRDGVPVY